MSAKKVAVVLTGRLVNNQEQYQNFKKSFLEPLSGCRVDIFVCHSKGYTSEHIENFKELYRPTVILENDEIHEQQEQIDKFRNDGAILRNFINMYRNRFRALRLLELQDVDYDLIISSRTDLWFNQPISLETFVEKAVYIPNGADWGGINDQCAFGSFDEMKVYLNLYSNMVELVEKGCKVHPESLLREHLIKEKVPIIRFVLSYHIRRY